MKIGFFGDIVLENNIKIDKELNWIKNNDYNFINLEGPFILENQKIKKSVNIYSKNNIEFLKNYNFNLINVANNHFFDFGENNARKTKKTLLDNSFKVIGYGENIEEALKPIILKNSYEKEIGIFSFSCEFIDTITAKNKKAGLSPFSEKKILNILKQYEYLDFKICYFHYGVEYEDYPEPYYKNFFKFLIENKKVDVIIGTHPHCIQGIETFQDKFIFYSLGDFIFPEKSYLERKITSEEKSKYGYFVNLEIREIIEYKIIEYKIINSGTEVILDNHNKVSEFSKKLLLSEKEYLKFYKKNRIRKRFPIRGNNEKINNFKYFLYKIIERKLYICYSFFKNRGIGAKK